MLTKGPFLCHNNFSKSIIEDYVLAKSTPNRLWDYFLAKITSMHRSEDYLLVRTILLCRLWDYFLARVTSLSRSWDYVLVRSNLHRSGDYFIDVYWVNALLGEMPDVKAEYLEIQKCCPLAISCPTNKGQDPEFADLRKMLEWVKWVKSTSQLYILIIFMSIFLVL